jgi:hypothetical protein
LLKIEGAFMPLDRRRTFGHHATMDEVLSVCEDQLTGTEVVMTGVRNPYDAFASWFVRNWNHFQMRNLETVLGREPRIKEFLDIWLQMDEMPQLSAAPWLRDGRMFYHTEARVFVRQEHLQTDLDVALRKIPGAPGRAPPLGRENVTEGKDHWTTYYGDADYAFVNEKFRDDIAKFGYSFVWSNDAFA